MIPEGKLGASLPAFLETFRCPCCGGNTFARESMANPTLMAGMSCSCGALVLVLYNYDAHEIVWSATKEVVARGRPWSMQYASWNDRTVYSAGDFERSFPGFVAPERFVKLVLYF